MTLDIEVVVITVFHLHLGDKLLAAFVESLISFLYDACNIGYMLWQHRILTTLYMRGSCSLSHVVHFIGMTW